MFNGVSLETFSITQGIRQGDSISPYLSVFCVERWAHLIDREVSCHRWKPTKMSKFGLSISHLFFADDLLLFGEASKVQMETIIRCLDTFCFSFGQTVSCPKCAC